MDQKLLFSNLSSIRVDKKDVAYAFLVGSRAWGTHTQQSDFDVIVVTHKPTSTPSSSHTQQCDFTVLDKSNFATKIAEGSFLETLGLYTPTVIFVDAKFEPTLKALKQSVKIEAVQRWVLERCERDNEKAAKFSGKSQFRAALKVKCHSIRMRCLTDRLGALMQSQGSQMDDLSSPADPLSLRSGITPTRELVLFVQLVTFVLATVNKCNVPVGQTSAGGISSTTKEACTCTDAFTGPAGGPCTPKPSCVAGEYMASNGSCVACEAGYYCADVKTRVKCPALSLSNTDAQQLGQCACQAGYYGNLGETSNDGVTTVVIPGVRF
ncbi:hypothetical protein HDU79_006211 [Rhizoclosmatium sp. JEL0117]|nr:hypothetical protein HDU79_006211 [Rhizoclosmatium sp. JEL0117]